MERIVKLATPPAVLEVAAGDKIAVHWSFVYQGQAYGETVYVAVYEGDWPPPGIDEKIKASVGVTLPNAPDPVIVKSTEPLVTNAVTDAMVGKTFGIYIKIGNTLPEEGTGAFDNVIKVKGVPSPTFSQLKIISYEKV